MDSSGRSLLACFLREWTTWWGEAKDQPVQMGKTAHIRGFLGANVTKPLSALQPGGLSRLESVLLQPLPRELPLVSSLLVVLSHLCCWRV